MDDVVRHNEERVFAGQKTLNKREVVVVKVILLNIRPAFSMQKLVKRP